MTTNLFKLICCGIAFFISESQAFGALPQETHRFEYKYNGQKFIYATDSMTWEVALDKGAKACFSYFKHVRPLNEETGLELIDVCANPRAKKEI